MFVPVRNKSFQSSCDGGASTGKSTGAKMIAKKYKLKFSWFTDKYKILLKLSNLLGLI